MRTFRNNAVEAITVTVYILRYCQGSPMGARDISRIHSAGPFFSTNTFNLGGSIENTFEPMIRPVSTEKLFSIPEPEPGNPVRQENGYRYERPNEPRLGHQSGYETTFIDNHSPPQQPIQRANKMNFDVDPSSHHDIDETEVRFKENSKSELKKSREIRPRQKKYADVSGSPSSLDIIVFKNDEENKIPYMETSTKGFSTSDYTGTPDYESTTYEDDLDLRIGVSDQLAASLLG